MKIDDVKLQQYEDMLDMERPISKKHKPMEREKRAAQFAPFAALTGYEAAILDTQRKMEERFEDEYEVKQQATEDSFYAESWLDE